MPSMIGSAAWLRGTLAYLRVGLPDGRQLASHPSLRAPGESHPIRPAGARTDLAADRLAAPAAIMLPRRNPTSSKFGCSGQEAGSGTAT